MKHVMAKYKAKRDKIGEVREAVAEFVDAVKKNEPGTLVYEAFQEVDGDSFVHIMTFKDDKAEQVHGSSDYVKKFVQLLYPYCDEEPVFTKLQLVRSNKR